MDLVELIADDYLELHVEREVIKCQQKLTNITFNFEDKMSSYSYILQHYRLVNNNLMASSFQKFTDNLNSNKNAMQ